MATWKTCGAKWEINGEWMWVERLEAGNTLLRVCWLLQMLFCHVCLSLSSSLQALCFISLLPFMSSLNLSDYSHKYLATTTIYNHPLVSLSFLPNNARSFLFISSSSPLLPAYIHLAWAFRVYLAFYSSMKGNRRKSVFFCNAILTDLGPPMPL